MMNKIFAAMIILSVICSIFTGRASEVSDAAINSCVEAVELFIYLIGGMCMWGGLMKIAENTGIIKSAVKHLMPLLHFLFPGIPKNHKANEYIATNFIANIFGLGWAATPAGLKAMKELERLKEEQNQEGTYIKKEVASTEMCTFLIINISSLQLIPVNIIAYRSQYGSVNPTAIVGPAIVATFVSTIVAVLFCKIMEKIRN